MNDKETFYRLALIHMEHYGNGVIKKLIRMFGSATALFEQKGKVAAKLYEYRASLQLPHLTDSIRRFVEGELEYARKNDIGICFFDDLDYPTRLLSCNDAPYYFYYKGCHCFNGRRHVAIVGTRNATNYGKDVVKKLVGEMAASQVSIISGLARGIDTMAHEEALAHGLTTIAVLGCGLKTIYPAENKKLAHKIIESGGSLISEYFFDAMPDRINFPKRNRIIAGLSDAVVVAESQEKGGSIITAEIAHSYNRDVFAVPGNIFQKSQNGCHELIRNNMAALVHSGKNIIQMMGWDQEKKKSIQKSLFLDVSPEEKPVMDIIHQYREAGVDLISELLPELAPSKIAALLLSLELKGVIECKPGKVYTTIY
ncbi:MAG: DNA-processing protein DprA [Bacteroidales bacterium]|nr:DNA-processing protein DprA [Bacteroidales bacterium]